MEKKKISFSDCTRHLYIPSLNTISKMSIYGMRTWLIKSNNYIVTNSDENHVDICFYDLKEPLAALVLSVKLDAPAPCRLVASDLDFACRASADCLPQHLQVI